MKNFFKVATIEQVMGLRDRFPVLKRTTVPLSEACGRILGKSIAAPENLPGFRRATMDGYAVRAASTFGASESNPAYLTITGTSRMGESPDFSIGNGEAARISTGAMLPNGSDCVVMVEHTEALDETTLEIYKSAAPGQYVIEPAEDFAKDDIILSEGKRLRAQEVGLLAAFGRDTVQVFRRPVIAVISTGDELVPIMETPGPGKIRDINTHTLAALIQECGAIPVSYGIVPDNRESLERVLKTAVEASDMVLLSGGSSVGVRDIAIDALSGLPETDVLIHGVSISPGKPAILAISRQKAIWGLPGHVTSTMVVFLKVVKPFISHISGAADALFQASVRSARLSRNVASAQGRVDYIRVKLRKAEDGLVADPILGKSGLINTMVKADGLVEIGLNVEGLNQGTVVEVELLT